MAETNRKLPRGITMDRGLFKVSLTYQGNRYTLGRFDSLTDARAALDIAKGEKARGTFIPPAERKARARAAAELERARALTLSQWAHQWLEDMTALVDKGERSLGTVRSYRSTLECHILPLWAQRRLVDITHKDIEALTSTIPSTGARTNVERTLSAMFNAAIKAQAGGLEKSPVTTRMHKARAATLEDSKVATPEQVNALAAAMPPHLALTVHLAAWCALRQGEVLGLQRRDFENLDDPTRALVHVRRQWNSKAEPPTYTPPKTKAARTIAIPAPLVPIIRTHLTGHTGKPASAPLFPAPYRDDAPIGQTTLDKAWRKARAVADMGTFRFHDLRHTGLTRYAQAGATLAELLNRGGHTNVDVALRYQHATLERDRALTALLSEQITLS